jgi:hypothetical protein
MNDHKATLITQNYNSVHMVTMLRVNKRVYLAAMFILTHWRYKEK